jgi:hypothetical protein
VRRERWLEDAGGWLSAMLYAPGRKDKEGDIVNNDDDYTLIDEVVHYGTIIFLVLMTITFLGVVAGFLWGML